MKKQNLKKRGKRLLYQVIFDSMIAVAPKAPETAGEANHAAITIMNKLFDKYTITFNDKKNCIKIQYEKKNSGSTGGKEEPSTIERDSELDTSELQKCEH